MTPMNDAQKDIALQLAVIRAQMTAASTANTYRYDELGRELIKLLTAYDAAADAPKRKYTVADIKRPQIMRMARGAYWYIRCGDYDWTSDGWSMQREGASGFPKHVADVIYAGLVATGNVPEVGE